MWPFKKRKKPSHVCVTCGRNPKQYLGCVECGRIVCPKCAKTFAGHLGSHVLVCSFVCAAKRAERQAISFGKKRG